ncbi:MAG TPA: hypothetical protein VIK74_05635 [Parasegetibacter sp.]
MKRRLLLAAVVLGLAGLGYAWYILSATYDDTSNVKADFNVEATAFIQEFVKDRAAANEKYMEKIISVAGIADDISSPNDSLVTIRFSDSGSGSYAIFSFQENNMEAAKKVQQGEKVTIKGSCSGGNYSEILDLTSIEFKRCIIE